MFRKNTTALIVRRSMVLDKDSYRTLEKKTGISKSNLQNICNPKTGYNIDTLGKVLSHYEIKNFTVKCHYLIDINVDKDYIEFGDEDDFSYRIFDLEQLWMYLSEYFEQDLLDLEYSLEIIYEEFSDHLMDAITEMIIAKHFTKLKMKVWRKNVYIKL